MTHILDILVTVLGIVILLCIVRELTKPFLRKAKARREYKHWLEEVEPRLRYSKGYPADWQMRRHEVFDRFGGKCAGCAAWIRRSFVDGLGGHVHHRIPISEGGDHSFDNLELLCEDCHFKKHPGNKSIRFNQNRIVRALALSGAARRARKEWCCVGCDESIFVGDEYYGGIWSKLCLRCRNDVLKKSNRRTI